MLTKQLPVHPVELPGGKQLLQWFEDIVKQVAIAVKSMA